MAAGDGGATMIPHLSEQVVGGERMPCGSDVLNHNPADGNGNGGGIRRQPNAMRSLTSPVLPCHPELGPVGGGSQSTHELGGEAPRVPAAGEGAASEAAAATTAGLEEARWKHLWSYAFPYATPAVAEEQELGLPDWWLQTLEPSTHAAGKGFADRDGAYAAPGFAETPEVGVPAAWLHTLELEAGKVGADKDAAGKDASDVSGREVRNPAAAGAKKREKVPRKRASVAVQQPRIQGCSGASGALGAPLLQQVTSPPLRAGMSGWSSPKDVSTAGAKDTRSIFFGLGVRQILDEASGAEGGISPSAGGISPTTGIGRNGGHYRARSLM